MYGLVGMIVTRPGTSDGNKHWSSSLRASRKQLGSLVEVFDLGAVMQENPEFTHSCFIPMRNAICFRRVGRSHPTEFLKDFLSKELGLPDASEPRPSPIRSAHS